MGLILNWLVQGALVSGIVAAGVCAVRSRSARGRYRVWQLTLILVLALPSLSMTWVARLERAAPGHVAVSPVSTAALRTPLVQLPRGLWNATSMPLAIGVLWCAVHLWRLRRDLRSVGALRQRCRPLTRDLEQRVAATTRARVARDGADLVVSHEVRAAAALGIRRPLIVLHPDVVALVSDAELDQIVLHEWAHIHRHDLEAVLAERIIEAAVGWHPAVAWLLRRLRVERELACDEMTIAIGGSARAYAALLARLAALTTPPDARFIAANAIAASSLGRRVAHALTVRAITRPLSRHRMVALTAGLVLAARGVSSLAFFGPNIPPPAQQVVTDPSEASASVRDALETVSRGSATRAPVRRSQAATAPRRAAADPVRSSRARQEQKGETAPTEAAIADATPSVSPVQDAPATPDLGEPFTAPMQPPLMVRDLGLFAPDVGRHRAASPEALAPDAAGAGARFAEVGTTIGRRSQEGATATARFFTRFSKRVVSSVTSF